MVGAAGIGEAEAAAGEAARAAAEAKKWRRVELMIEMEPLVGAV